MAGRKTRSLVLLLLASVLLALAVPAVAAADDDEGRDDVRVTRRCSGSSTARLRVRDRDDELRVELDVTTRRRGATWAVVIVHERRVAFRARVRTSGSSGSFSLRRTIADWFGADTVTARATGPGGEACRLTATIRDD